MRRPLSSVLALASILLVMSAHYDVPHDQLAVSAAWAKGSVSISVGSGARGFTAAPAVKSIAPTITAKPNWTAPPTTNAITTGSGNRGFTMAPPSDSAPKAAAALPYPAIMAGQGNRGFVSNAPTGAADTTTPGRPPQDFKALPSSAYTQAVNREMAGASADRAAQAAARQAQIDAARKAPAFTQTTGGKVFSPDVVQSTRNVYYTNHVVYVPTYVHQDDSIGAFRAGFLYSTLSDPLFWHNHGSDPTYQQWLVDAEARARDNNDARLQAQIDQLKAQVAERRDQPRDVAYVPKDVPPEVMYADDVLVHHSSGGVSVWLIVGVLLTIVGICGYIFLVRTPSTKRYA